MPLYFAYGSNMDVDAMAARCPRSTAVGPARLPRHRFALTRRGFATVVRDARQEVWGILWDLALSDVAALDRWEEVGAGLYAKTTQAVIRERGRAVQALIYIAKAPDAAGRLASAGYAEAIFRAAQGHGFPPAYLAALHPALFDARGRESQTERAQ